jgi:hypothetical protein
MEIKHYSAQQIEEDNFFNNKGTLSVILLASVDDNYLFKYAHVSMQGRTCDGAVFLRSACYHAVTGGY